LTEPQAGPAAAGDEDPWAFLRGIAASPGAGATPPAGPPGADDVDIVNGGQWGPSSSAGPTFSPMAPPAGSLRPGPAAGDPFFAGGSFAASPAPAPIPAFEAGPPLGGVPPIGPPGWSAPPGGGQSAPLSPAPAPYAASAPAYPPPAPAYLAPAPVYPGQGGPMFPPPGAPWPPQPPARKGGRGGLLLVVASLVAVALIGAGVAVSSGTFKTASGPTFPKQWDSRVADLVKFVEDNREHTYKHPVEVDFLTADQYSAASRTDSGSLSSDDKAGLDNEVAMMRSLGVMSGNIDLLSKVNEVQDSGTLAFYSPKDRKVRVRGTDMTVDLKVTLVHELTHALQDQYFDLGRMDKMPEGQASAYRALAEGDAVRIEDKYVDSLSKDDKKAYDDAHNAEVDQSQSNLNDVPGFLQATFATPYFVGPPLAALLAERGTTVLDKAFKNPPVATAETFDYRAFLSNDATVDVPKPSIPPGANELNSGEFGADSWFLMLSERIDSVQALDAVDGWAGDDFVQYKQGDSTCVSAVYQGHSEAEGTQMLTALTAWKSTMPAEAKVEVASPKAGAVTMTTCDPGADAKQNLNDRALDVLNVPAIRLVLALEAQRGGATPSEAADFAACALDHIGEADALAIGRGDKNLDDFAPNLVGVCQSGTS
jgi:hypothetical protein